MDEDLHAVPYAQDLDNGKEEYDMTHRDGHDCILVHRELSIEDVKRYAAITRGIRRRSS